MKIVSREDLLDVGDYTSTEEFATITEHLDEAVRAIVHPPGSDRFILKPVKQGNGVKPIKEGFTEYLEYEGWELETRARRFDALYRFPTSDMLPFAVEWETGNISSSHRAMNRMALAILEGDISGGILVLPSRDMYKFLTDRIGNDQELRPYYKLWKEFEFEAPAHYLGVVVVEHDELSDDVPLLAKGTDGRALI